jgi:hypothetical protein
MRRILKVVVAVASYAVDYKMWFEAVDFGTGLVVVDAVVGDVLVSIVPFDVWLFREGSLGLRYVVWDGLVVAHRALGRVVVGIDALLCQDWVLGIHHSAQQTVERGCRDKTLSRRSGQRTQRQREGNV